MLRRLFVSEQGAVGVMMLGVFLTMLLVVFMAMGTLAAGVFKNAGQVYGEAGNALKWAVYAANFDGVLSGRTSLSAGEVAPYFDYAFQQITGTTRRGDDFTGGSLPGPVQLAALNEVPAGTALPSGTITNQPGFTVSLTVPVFSGGILGLSPLTITVTRFAVSQPMPVIQP